MRWWSADLLRRSTLALLAVALLSSALAASLAVHPFSSEDPLFGVAVAEEVAASFHGSALVFGPEVAAGLVPPLVVIDGFINLGRVLDPAVWTGPSGPGLIRSGAGVDVAVSGEIEQYDDRTVLRLEVAYPGGTKRAELSADPGDRERLVSLAVRIVAPLLGLEDAPTPVTGPALEGAYADYMNAVLLAASGLVTDAAAALGPESLAELPARAAELDADLEAVVASEPLDEGEASGDATDDADAAGATGDADAADTTDGTDAAATDAPDVNETARRLARRGLFALSLPTLHETNADAAFAELSELTGLAVAEAWRGVLAADRGDIDAAEAAFEAAGARGGDYRYAAALLASLLQSRGEVDAALELLDALAEAGPAAGSAPLLAASVVALMLDDAERQVATLEALAHAAPFLAYPHQELSFLAFDRDDALAAAEALAVAVELEPASSLYWTNLGWATYLLGFLAESEAASLLALELDANQYIAAYNLGLVRAVTGRLSQALEAYDYAVALDPGIDDEVIVDLVAARERYPDVSAVEYALARLYEAKGRRGEAREAYRRFLRLAEAETAGQASDYVTTAQERLVVLSAPPPPLEILGAVDVRLGRRGPDAAPYHPGDTVFPAFELSTPGDQLPALVTVTVTLLPREGGEALSEASTTVEPPAGAVGFVVSDVALQLPPDLAPGDYRVAVDASGGEDLAVAAETVIRVAGAVEPVRQLFGRNVVMTGLEIEAPLYGAADLVSTDRVVERMVQELRDSAAAAEEALPTVEGGRFDGLSGSELFLRSGASDVVDFLEYVVSTGASDSRFTFVDGYAQWAIDGAPAAE